MRAQKFQTQKMWETTSLWQQGAKSELKLINITCKNSLGKMSDFYRAATGIWRFRLTYLEAKVRKVSHHIRNPVAIRYFHFREETNN